MVERLKDGRYRVLVSVHRAGQKAHTIPCPKLNCPVCSKLQGRPVDRSFAEAVEREFETQLKASRKEERALSSPKCLRDALARYRSTRINEKTGDMHKAESTYARLLSDLGPKPLTAAYSSLKTWVDEQTSIGDLAPSSINRHIQMIKAAVNELHKTRVGNGDTRLIPENYLSSFPLLPEQNIDYLILSDGQLDKLWEVIDSRLKPFLYFSLRVPIREGEALNITREHIDPFNRLLSLPYEYTKQGDLRQIKIVDEFWPYVVQFLASPATYLFNRGEAEGYQPLGYVDPEGKVAFSFKHRWRAAVEAVGVPNFNLHKLRQQSVMALYAAGWSEDDIRLYGGWAPKSRSNDAFYHYFNSEMALWIRQGQHKIDLGWHRRYAEVWNKVA